MTLATALSRRLVLKAGLTAATAAGLPRQPVAQQAGADLVLVALADLHSSYQQLPLLLGAIRGIAARAGAPVRILINGDIFERGNAVALKSNGAADLAFLRALGAVAPVILNIGNHETALVDDPKTVIRLLSEQNVTVISNIVDPRSNAPYAPASTRIRLGATEVAIAGIATDMLATYRQPVRPLITLPKPADHARANLPELMRGAGLAVLMSHAGVADDKAMLPMLPPHSLLIGGHEHLRFHHADAEGRVLFHGGSWGNHLRVVSVEARDRDGLRLRTAEYAVDAGSAAPDGALAAEIARQEELHLTAEDRAEIATLPRAYDLSESALIAADAVRWAAGADAAFLSHTTLGNGLPAGRIDKYRFDSFVRFDGEIRAASVDGATLRTILRGANQHKAATLDGRSGDFVYATGVDVDPAARYRIATNSWVAMNQQSYLGVSGIPFEPVPGLRLKAIAAEALRTLR